MKQDQRWPAGCRFTTPFGVIYSPNITPDPQTGIGKWSKDDFWNAMHRGIDDEGKHLYPAFPYPSFTKLSRADVDAIKDYLASVPPVKHQNLAPDLQWPLELARRDGGLELPLLSTRASSSRTPAKSAEWNRGAYLVKAPATVPPATRRKTSSARARATRRFRAAAPESIGTRRA